MADSILFLDVENTTLSLRNHLHRQFDAREVINAAGGWDCLHDAVAYADFTKVPEAIGRCLRRAGFTTRQVAGTGGPAGKDLVDFEITIDIMETVLTRADVQRIVLVAGDGDYVPLIARAQQLGKTVLVLAVEATLSRELSQTVETQVVFLVGAANVRRVAAETNSRDSESGQLRPRVMGE